MLRILVLAGALFFAALGHAYAGGPPPEAIDLRMRTNSEFLKAAAKIVGEHGIKEANGILRLAEEAYKEAVGHVDTGEYEFALEDLYDSTRKAMHAIILSVNANDSSIRDIVMKEEVALLAEREHERKEARLKKGMAEVEAFIKTADRLLKSRGGNGPVAAKLDETKALYAASKERIAVGDYDAALDGVHRAYKLAVTIVKEIKTAQGDILTFPKAEYADAKDLLAYEMKKNDAYAFFAYSLVKDSAPGGLLSKGLSLRDATLKSMADGKETETIDGLRKSTELLIKAIKASGN